MRSLVPVITAVMAWVFAASSASAQACVGLPTFEGRPIHVNATAEFPEGVKAYAIGIGLGKANGPFGNVGAGQVSFDDFSEKATLGFAEVGWQIPLGRFQGCPIAGASFSTGPNDDLLGIEASGWSATGGAAVGLPLAAGPAQVIPNAALRIEHASQKVSEVGIGEETTTYDSTFLDLGLALVLAGRFSVQPLIHIPVSGDDADEDATVGIFLSVGLP